MPESPPPPRVIPIADVGNGRRKVRSAQKGRVPDAQAIAEIRALLGGDPRRRDLLIEYLHRIQDAHGHISAAHVVALAAEMKLAMTEVYEVATFYHHFDVVKEGDAVPPRLTVRVCDSLSCSLAGARDLLDRLPAMLGPDVRVIPAPCVGRCHAAPVAVVGQNPVDAATAGRRAGRGPRRRGQARRRILRDLCAIPRGGWLHDGAGMRRRRARSRGGAEGDGELGPARPGRRRLPRRAQMAHRARRTGAASSCRQHRRRRAGYVQGPLLPRARSASLPRRHADRGVGRGHWRDLHLPARRIRGLPRNSRPRACGVAGRSPVRAAGDPSASRRRRLHLRRGVGDDRVDRRQARHAAAAPAVRGAGRPLRPAHARAQHGDALLGARHPGEGRRVVLRPRPPRPQGLALVLGVRPRGAIRACTSRRPGSPCAS